MLSSTSFSIPAYFVSSSYSERYFRINRELFWFLLKTVNLIGGKPFIKSVLLPFPRENLLFEMVGWI